MSSIYLSKTNNIFIDLTYDLSRQYNKGFFTPRFGGANLSHLLFQYFQNTTDIYLKDLPDLNLDKAVGSLYPEFLVGKLENHPAKKR